MRKSAAILLVSLSLLLAACGGSASKSTVGNAPATDLYVSAATGSDTNDGLKPTTPLATLQAALGHSTVNGLHPVTIHVAAGTYSVDSSTAPITLVNGVSLLGGYSPSDWTLRDPVTNVTTIQETVAAATGISAPVVSPTGITRASEISGFTILGLTSGTGTATMSGVLVQAGSSPIIRQNVIVSGCATGTTIAHAVQDEGGSPWLDGNTLYAVNQSGCPATDLGLYDRPATTTTGAPELTGNTLHIKGPLGVTAGTESLFAVRINSSNGAVVSGNDILFPNTTNGFNGIMVGNGSNQANHLDLIENNILNLGAAQNSSMGIQANYTGNQGQATIRGNQIYNASVSGVGKTFWPVRVLAATGPVLIQGNTISNHLVVSSGNTGIAVSNTSGAVTVADNTIQAIHSTVSSLTGIDFFTISGDIVVTGNRVQLGNGYNAGTAKEYALYLNNVQNALVARNTLHASSGASTAGLAVNAAAGTVRVFNNLLYGGSGALSSAGIVTSTSLGTLKVYNNTIHGGTSPVSMGANLGTVGTAVEFVNNLITVGGGATSSHCFKATLTNVITRAENNNLTGCLTAVYDNNTVLSPTVADFNTVYAYAANNLALPNNLVNQNGLDGNILTSLDNDWRLSATSDVLLQTGGLTLLDLSDDFAGSSRTAPWSLGAYEY